MMNGGRTSTGHGIGQPQVRHRLGVAALPLQGSPALRNLG
jgi:hypothetical protein